MPISWRAAPLVLGGALLVLAASPILLVPEETPLPPASMLCSANASAQAQSAEPGHE